MTNWGCSSAALRRIQQRVAGQQHQDGSIFGKKV
jgi:hypothetical protein